MVEGIDNKENIGALFSNDSYMLHGIHSEYSPSFNAIPFFFCSDTLMDFKIVNHWVPGSFVPCFLPTIILTMPLSNDLYEAAGTAVRTHMSLPWINLCANGSAWLFD